MSSRDTVKSMALELIDATPTGKRYSELFREIAAACPSIPRNTIHGALYSFRCELPPSVYQPAKGIYRSTRYRDTIGQEPTPAIGGPKSERIREEDFYDAFRDWLINEVEECTKAISLGGNRFRDKWGTPDVVGIREPRRSDIVKFPTEIVSAEIKLDPANLITAFGQACSYKLFSHKSYIVVPSGSSDDDKTRLDALCRIFGIGLIIFNPLNPKNPGFVIKSRASREEPDMFYVNKYLKLVEEELFA